MALAFPTTAAGTGETAPPANGVVMATAGQPGNRNLWELPIHADFVRAAGTAWSVEVTFQLVSDVAAGYATLFYAGPNPNALMVVVKAPRQFGLHKAGVADILLAPNVAAGSEYTFTATITAGDATTIYQGASSVATGTHSGVLGTAGASDISKVGSDNTGGSACIEADILIRDIKIWQGQAGTPAALALITPDFHFPVGIVIGT